MKHDWEIIGINELEKLAIEWAAFDLQNKYSPAIIKLIAAYRESVAALKHYAQEDIRNARHYPNEFAKDVLATAKRLGVE